MGASEFVQYQKGADMAQAYRAAVAEAVDEYGHDGYNGTISTTSGARQVLDRPVTQGAAELFAADRILRDSSEVQKWGPALAIPVADSSSFTFTEKKFTFTMDPQQPETDRRLPSTRDVTEYDVRDEGRTLAISKFGTAVHSLEITPKLKTAVTATFAKGRAVTRWAVGGRNYGSRVLFDTRAEAVAAAKRRVQTEPFTAAVGVEPVRVWPESDNTTAAVMVRRVTVSARGDVTVTLARPIGSPAIVGWVFYGLAAC